MNGEKEDEYQHSGSKEELERSFSARMHYCAKRLGSVSALAKKAGISQSGIRRYFTGGEPSRPHLVAIADAAGVRLAWLATGEGAMTKEGGIQETGAHYQTEAAPALDMEKLEEVITKTRRMLQERNVRLKPEAEAKVIRLIYEYYIRHTEGMDETTLDNVIQLAAFR